MTQLSGQRCTVACLVQNRARFVVGMTGALLIGATVGIVVRQFILASIIVAVLVAATSPLADRRILGLTDTGVVQRRAATFTTAPTSAIASTDMTLQVKSGRKNPLFRIDGRTYLGATGSREFAEQLRRSRTP